MADTISARVAVYLDFDNVVISRYDEVHGRGSFQRDKQRADAAEGRRAEFDARLESATVDLGAVLDFAASYGTVVLTRAYADWSSPVNARYRGQLVGRAVDLVQLFPAAAYGKNGADIRLAVDAVEDLFRLPELTHVLIVAGDSDHIALAQRCRRLGRTVVGIGVAGSTSRALAAACDELVTYDALPGIVAEESPAAEADPQREATALLERAMRIGHEKEDTDWLHNSEVKTQIKRMDPSFSERRLGFRSFSDFLRSRGDLVELDESSTARLVRLRSQGDTRA